MNEPLTEELLNELLNAPNPSAYVNENMFVERDFASYITQIAHEKGLKRAEVVRKAGLDATFGYQIFKGQRGASRNKVLQLVFALSCSLREANRALKAAGHNELYCKNKRDAIIIFCISHGYDLQTTDEELFRFGETTIC